MLHRKEKSLIYLYLVSKGRQIMYLMTIMAYMYRNLMIRASCVYHFHGFLVDLNIQGVSVYAF